MYVPVVNDKPSLPLVWPLNAPFLPVLNAMDVCELRGHPFNFLLSMPVSLHRPGATLATQWGRTGVDLRAATQERESKSKEQVAAGAVPRAGIAASRDCKRVRRWSLVLWRMDGAGTHALPPAWGPTC